MRYIPFAIALVLAILTIPVRPSGPGLALFALPAIATVVLGWLAFRDSPAKGQDSPQEAQSTPR